MYRRISRTYFEATCRLGLNPFTLLLSVIVGLCLVISYFYLLSFLLGEASPDRGPGGSDDPNGGGRRRLLLWGEAYTRQGIYTRCQKNLAQRLSHRRVCSMDSNNLCSDLAITCGSIIPTRRQMMNIAGNEYVTSKHTVTNDETMKSIRSSNSLRYRMSQFLQKK